MSFTLTRIPLFLLALAAPLLFSGCGVFTDMVRDNEVSVPFLNSPSFMSPAKLRVGVMPFQAQQDLGTPETGAAIAKLVSEEFSRNGNLVMVPPERVKAYADAAGMSSPITPGEAVRICRDLNLNLVMDGTFANLGQHQVRSGWRRLFRWFTNQQIYIEAILSLTAYDPADGSVITSRAGESRIRVGRAPRQSVYGAAGTYNPTQEDIEESLDEAINFLYLRSLEGLKVFPFKARVISVLGDKATINFGSDVKLKRKTDFALLSTSETLVSAINVSYDIPGAPLARLRVDSVDKDRATLTILDGTVSPGDIVQSWDFRD
ncbi:MAG: hypothetical protein LBF41_08175 [Deltaproteobacteria bacterium]|jgi:hypothetical protein|nr:hypothetical protein [Deltaproteobacteria bacterium]